MLKVAKTLVGFVLGLLLTVTPAFGQAETGSISGTVRDATGAVISGATVTAKSLATGAERTATTGSIGQYSILALTPGSYQVTIASANFQTYRTTVEVTVGGVSIADAKLQVGQSSSVIEVVGGAVTQVNTETQELCKRLTNTPVRQAGSVLKCPDDRKNRVVSAQATYTSGGSAVGG